MKVEEIQELIKANFVNKDDVRFLTSLKADLELGKQIILTGRKKIYFDDIKFNCKRVFEQSEIIEVTPKIINKAKKQITEFEKTEKGSHRYSGVEAWRGVVCEFLVSNWLEKNFNVETPAKGIDTSGLYDDYDLIIEGKTVEIKSATKFRFGKITPKKPMEDSKKKEIYIGAKYNELVIPNQILIVGFILGSEINKYPIEQDKGVPYYAIPFVDLIPISQLKNKFSKKVSDSNNMIVEDEK